MTETHYPGIDYSGPGGTVNRDPETKIRYGIIPSGELNPDALDDIYSKGTDIGYEEAEQELKDKLRRVLEDYFNDHKRGQKGDGMNNGTSRLDVAVDDAFDALDGWADNIESNGPHRLEEDGLVVQTQRDSTDLWVFKSPFYTYAQFCSPCAPGACHLSHPLSVKIQAGIASCTHDVMETGEETFVDSNKCYCLGHDWFEDNKAPYRVFRVDNNEEVPSAS